MFLDIDVCEPINILALNPVEQARARRVVINPQPRIEPRRAHNDNRAQGKEKKEEFCFHTPILHGDEIRFDF